MPSPKKRPLKEELPPPPAVEPVEAVEPADVTPTADSTAATPSVKVPSKLHVELARATWSRLKAYIEAYNASETRTTPKIKPANVVNLALAEYLKGRA